MLDIKCNLDKRICDCEVGAENTETYREFIINGYAELGCDLNENLDEKTNRELNDMVDELDWLLSK